MRRRRNLATLALVGGALAAAGCHRSGIGTRTASGTGDAGAADTPALAHDAPPPLAPDAGGADQVDGAGAVDGADAVNSVQRSCIDAGTEPGCGLVEVPGGTFTLGLGTESPVPVRVGPFALDAYEVTIARFRRFWEAGRPAPDAPVVYPGGVGLVWKGGPVRDPGAHAQGPWGSRPIEGPSPRPFAPIFGVEWGTAMAFCVWDGGRLPTEAEWELAAGHLADGRPVPRRYPWGNEPPQGAPNAPCDRAWWNQCPGERNVGAFAATGGFYDLAGGVAEWTADGWAAFTDVRCWGSSPSSPLVNPLCADSPTGFGERVVRGGHAATALIRDLEVTSRVPSVDSVAHQWWGIRCARTRTAP